MALLGSHLSIAGGYHKAVEQAAGLGMDCVQIFTKNNNQWRAKPISAQDARLFHAALAKTGIVCPSAHDSYLINLASSDSTLWRQSIDAMVVELRRAHRLGIDHVVAHPGAHVGSGEDAGITRVACALDRVFNRTQKIPTTIALETTAGQGTSLGYRFEHLGQIIARCSFSERLTVCLDTCHVFAAGYPLTPKRKFQQTFRQLDKAVGLDRLVAFHLNDSKRPSGSRVDRHEHIGRGYLGTEPFAHLLKDRRFRNTPMYLETPKTTEPKTGLAWDTINLRLLRQLAAE